MAICRRARLVAILAIHLAAAPVVAQTTLVQADASSWPTLAKALNTRLEMTLTDDVVADRLHSATETPFIVDMRASLVTVTLRDKRIFTGYIDSLRQHSFFLIEPRTEVVTQVGYRQVANLSATSGKWKVVLTAVVIGTALIVWAVCYGAGGCGGVS